MITAVREALVRTTVRFQGVSLRGPELEPAYGATPIGGQLSLAATTHAARETPNSNTRTTVTGAAIPPRSSPPVHLSERLVDLGGMASHVPDEYAPASAHALSALPQTRCACNEVIAAMVDRTTVTFP